MLGFLYLFKWSDESTTLTELKAIASPAIIGGTMIPAGTSTPAARGIPSKL